MAGTAEAELSSGFDDDEYQESGDFEVQDADGTWRYCRMYTHKKKREKVLYYGGDEYEGIGEG